MKPWLAIYNLQWHLFFFFSVQIYSKCTPSPPPPPHLYIFFPYCSILPLHPWLGWLFLISFSYSCYLEAFLWIRPFFLNSLLGIFESHISHKTTVFMRESRFTCGYHYSQSVIAVSIHSSLSWWVGRRLAGGEWERTTVFAWSHSSWGDSPLIPFPAATGLSGLLMAAVFHSCLVLFRKGDSQRLCFLFLIFCDPPCLQIQVTLLQGLYSDTWLEINLFGDLSLHATCLPPFYVLYDLPYKHIFLFTIGFTEITTATIFNVLYLWWEASMN